MRNFDATIYAEMQKEILAHFFMVEFLFSATYRFTDSDIDIFDAEGSRFYSRPFLFGNIAGSSALTVDNIDLDFDDTDQVLSAILLGEDVRNKTAVLYFGVIANEAVDGSVWEDGEAWEEGEAWQPGYNQKRILSEEFVRGIVGGWELLEDNRARITLTNELVLWNKKTLRTQGISCPWEFKGVSGECGYTGAGTWCDQSYERCKVLGNQLNFAGNRFLPSIMQKEIYWGRSSNFKE